HEEAERGALPEQLGASGVEAIERKVENHAAERWRAGLSTGDDRERGRIALEIERAGPDRLDDAQRGAPALDPGRRGEGAARRHETRVENAGAGQGAPAAVDDPQAGEVLLRHRPTGELLHGPVVAGEHREL